MGKYYNTTKAPVCVTVADGKAFTVPPKSWCEVSESDAGSGSFLRAVEKGFLARAVVDSGANKSTGLAETQVSSATKKK